MSSSDFNFDEKMCKKMLAKPFRYDFYNYKFDKNKRYFEKYMIVGHNPGDRLKAEQAEDLCNAREDAKCLSIINRRWLIRYLKGIPFWGHFQKTFGLEFDQIVEHFYFTDVIKDRGRTECDDEDVNILKKEIRFLGSKCKAVLAFGEFSRKEVKKCLEDIYKCKYKQNHVIGGRIKIFKANMGPVLCHLPHYSNRGQAKNPVTPKALKELKKFLDDLDKH